MAVRTAGAGNRSAKDVDHVIFAARSFADETDDRSCDLVELEDGGAGDEVEKMPSGGVELVKFPRGQSNHALLHKGAALILMRS